MRHNESGGNFQLKKFSKIFRENLDNRGFHFKEVFCLKYESVRLDTIQDVCLKRGSKNRKESFRQKRCRRIYK